MKVNPPGANNKQERDNKLAGRSQQQSIERQTANNDRSLASSDQAVVVRPSAGCFLLAQVSISPRPAISVSYFESLNFTQHFVIQIGALIIIIIFKRDCGLPTSQSSGPPYSYTFLGRFRLVGNKPRCFGATSFPSGSLCADAARCRPKSQPKTSASLALRIGYNQAGSLAPKTNTADVDRSEPEEAARLDGIRSVLGFGSRADTDGAAARAVRAQVPPSCWQQIIAYKSNGIHFCPAHPRRKRK